MTCLGYRLLERARRSWLVARLVYGGDRVRLKAQRAIVGAVVRTPSHETDGDCTFDVQTDAGVVWHCEVTPCATDALRRVAYGLPLGARVYVHGTERWDPAHFGSAGRQEIHPVSTIIRKA